MVLRDVRYAIRSFARTPGFSVLATGILAVALAGSSVLFAAYSKLALQGVPGVTDMGRLISIGLTPDEHQWLPFTTSQFTELSGALSRPDEIVGATLPLRYKLEIDDVSADIRVSGVTHEFFGRLGVTMLLGVDLASASADPEAMNVVISEHYWRSRFNSSRNIVGSIASLGDQKFSIVGVAKDFRGLRRDLEEDAWIPIGTALALRSAPPHLTKAQWRVLSEQIPTIFSYARLSNSATSLSEFKEEIDAAIGRLGTGWLGPYRSAAFSTVVLPGTSASPRNFEMRVRQITLMTAGAVLILIVACMNIASYFLARGLGRLGEFRTRLAVGASRQSIIQQLVIEATVIIAAASIIALLIQYWARELLEGLLPSLPSNHGELDWRAVVFFSLLLAAVGIIAALIPALRVARDKNLMLSAQPRMGEVGNPIRWIMVAQVTVSVLIVLAGALFTGDLFRLARFASDLPTDEIGLSTIRVANPAVPRFPSDAHVDIHAQLTEIDQRLGSVPGLTAFALASSVPFQGYAMNPEMVESETSEESSARAMQTFRNSVTSGFFDAFGIPLIRGRTLDGRSREDILVSRSLARQLWGRDDVIGLRLRPSNSFDTDEIEAGYRVVGVVGDIAYDKSQTSPPMWYQSLEANALGAHVVIRGSAEKFPVVREVISAALGIWWANRELTPFATLEERIWQTTSSERNRSLIAAGAALLSLLLTALGLYASLQYTVAAKSGALAVRKVLGASERAVRNFVLRDVGKIVAIGCAGALLFILIFRDFVRTVFVGLDPIDPMGWMLTLAVIALVAFAAAWPPARRAGRVDPAVILRAD